MLLKDQAVSVINLITSSGRNGVRSQSFNWVLCTLEYVSVVCEFGNVGAVGVCVNTQWKGDRTQEGMNSTTQSV
jgi:hypothetical protein